MALTASERLIELSDTIISTVIRSGSDAMTARHYAFSELPVTVFRDENFILYTVLYNFKEQGITPDRKFISQYLLRNKKLIRQSKDYIDLSAFKDVDGDTEMAYTVGVLKKYDALMSITPVAYDDFKLLVAKYKLEYSAYGMNKIYSEAKEILYDGAAVGAKKYQGLEDSIAYTKQGIANIQSLNDHVSGQGFIDASKEGMSDSEVIKPTLLAEFDLIPELNEYLGGYYTSIFYNIIAPTKGGKSKWCARAVHSMLMEGHNVSIWAHEGGYKAWWAQMRAIHYEYLYNRNTDVADRVQAVSQNDILMDKYPNEEIKLLENSSRIDLFTNPKYGVMNMIERPFKVETFLDEIETSVQINNSEAVVIDYLQLIGWDSKGMSKPQAIGQAYQGLLAYAKKRNVLVMSPSQMTQEFLKEMANSKDSSNKETRTSGGESSEVIRTPDVNIALYASVADLQAKRMQIISIPSRLAQPFPSIDIHADLCSCVFSSVQKQ